MSTTTISTVRLLIEKAFSKQDQVNGGVKTSDGIPVGPDWKKQGWPYYRAGHTEATEALNYLNWFWWKSGQYGKPLTADILAEVHIELCDILHFGLSQDIIKFTGKDSHKDLGLRAVDYELAFQEAPLKAKALDVELEDFITSTILSKEQFCVYTFARACSAAQLTLPQLLVYYFAKATLNEFRQNNGYNLPKGTPGAYIKMWGGAGQEPQEDNFFLIRAVRSLLENNEEDALVEGLADGSFQAGLYERLKRLYPGNGR